MTAFVCAGVTECLESTGTKGRVGGYMTVSFEASGKAHSVSLPGSIAQSTLGRCFLDLGGAKVILPVAGALPGPCEISCKYSGTVRAPATALNFSSDFYPGTP